jgi:hypothetical protein
MFVMQLFAIRRYSPRKQFLLLAVAAIIIAVALLVFAAVLAWGYFRLQGSSATFSAAEATQFCGLLLLLSATLAALFVWIAVLTFRSRKHLPDGLPDAAPASQTVCAECQGAFDIHNMIEHHGTYICARCKPIFLQKLAEGVLPMPGSTGAKNVIAIHYSEIC